MLRSSTKKHKRIVLDSEKGGQINRIATEAQLAQFSPSAYFVGGREWGSICFIGPITVTVCSTKTWYRTWRSGVMCKIYLAVEVKCDLSMCYVLCLCPHSVNGFLFFSISQKNVRKWEKWQLARFKMGSHFPRYCPETSHSVTSWPDYHSDASADFSKMWVKRRCVRTGSNLSPS